MEKLGSAPIGTLTSIIGPIENVLISIGLNSPLKRFFFTTLSGSAMEFMFKPSYAFTGDGSMKRPIYITRNKGDTYTPAGLIPGILGLLFSLFI